MKSIAKLQIKDSAGLVIKPVDTKTGRLTPEFIHNINLRNSCIGKLNSIFATVCFTHLNSSGLEVHLRFIRKLNNREVDMKEFKNIIIFPCCQTTH